MFEKSLKKFIFSLFAVMEIFLLSVPTAMGAFEIPSFDSMANEGEDRYNVDGGAVRDMMQGMNVAGRKATVPELMVIFSPQNPTPGEEVSAQALPMYFSNDAKNLYFTWYLKHNIQGERNGGNIDWNNDEEIDIEDYKIEAMRILAQGGWEPDLDKDGDGTNDHDSVNAWYNAQTDDDDDGYKAISGGDNKKGANNYCYLHDFTGGKNYEFTKNAAGNKPEITCANGMTPVCANTYTPLEMKPVQKYDVCADDNKRDGEDDKKNLFCEAGAKEASCHGEDVTAVCYEEKGEDEELGIFSEEILRHGDEEMDTTIGAPVLITEECKDFPKPQCSNTPAKNEGGECQVNGTRKHLFPRAPGRETGDGSFSLEEERFWGTNPHDASTAGGGYADESVVAGLGQEIFKWTYQEGDLVGVVIEGTSILTTKHADSSSMIMWAFVKNHCSAYDFPATAKGITQIEAGSYPVMIDTVEADINDKCLDKHTKDDSLTAFLDPVGSADEKLDLKLSYLPEIPINDPADEGMGDEVSLQTIINNSTKEEQELLFNWEVDICDNGTFSCRGGTWRDISEYLMKKEVQSRKLRKGGVKGNGLSELKFELGINPDDPYDLTKDISSSNPKIGNNVFKDGVGYIRAKVKVRETFSSGMSRQGIATSTMKIISTKEKIKAYKVGNSGAMGSPNLNLIDSNNGDSDPLTPICSGSGAAIDGNIVESNVVCRVMKNEIIGLQVPNEDGAYDNFNWILDGKPLVCDKGMSNSCEDEKMTNINFFPVTKGAGESFTLTVNATENVSVGSAESKVGKKITLVKRFEVIEPYVKIVSVGADLSKLMGAYVDLQGDSYEDRSESVFEIVSGEAVALRAEMHPAWIDVVKINEIEAKSWTLDGETQGSGEDCGDGNNNCVSFVADKNAGEAYVVNFSAVYNKNVGIRRALFDLWGIVQQESGDEQMADRVIVEVKATEDGGIGAVNKSKRFLASLSANLPGQVIFMLRIILTGFVIIFISGVVFSLSARREEKDSGN